MPPVDRFLRSALFPLIVIVLLVYLASQTLLGEDRRTTTVSYSQVVASVEREAPTINRVVLERGRGVTVERADGTTWKAKNPSEASQLALERRLIARRVPYDWKEWSSSPAWSLLTGLLPFALLMAFFVILTRRRDERLRVPEGGGS